MTDCRRAPCFIGSAFYTTRDLSRKWHLGAWSVALNKTRQLVVAAVTFCGPQQLGGLIADLEASLQEMLAVVRGYVPSLPVARMGVGGPLIQASALFHIEESDTKR